MATPPDATRRYTDREVRVILKSAVELQQRRDHGADVSGGMSLAQLEQVAVEAGVDPELVLRAAAQLDTTASPSSHSAFLGGPTHIVLERVVERSIHPGAFDQLLDVTRGITHEVGEVSTVGRQFGWKGRLDGAKTEVSVSAEDRRTTLRVRGELGATRVSPGDHAVHRAGSGSDRCAGNQDSRGRCAGRTTRYRESAARIA